MRLTALFVGAISATAIAVAVAPSAYAETTENKKSESKTVVIEPGDSLSKIAKAHDTTYHRLFDANLEIENPDLIYPGDDVRVPHPDEELAERALPTTAPKREEAAKPKAQAVTANAPRRVAPKATPQPTGAISGSVWDRLAQCEAGGNWGINTGNGYYGGLQFTLSSWRAVGGSGYPHQASKSEQIARGEKLQALQGWGAWPACTAKLGIR